MLYLNWCGKIIWYKWFKNIKWIIEMCKNIEMNEYVLEHTSWAYMGENYEHCIVINGNIA